MPDFYNDPFSDPAIAAALSNSGYGGGGGVIPAPVTRESLYHDTYGVTQPRMSYGFDDQWRNNPNQNPNLQQATPDDRVLANQSMLHDLAQKAYMNALANHSGDQVNLLKSIAASGVAPNLFGAPANPMDKQVQGIVQNDLNAGYRGWRLIDTPDTARKRALDNLKLAAARQDYQIKAGNFNNASQKQDYTQNRQDMIDRFNQQLAKGKQADLNNYRTGTLSQKAQSNSALQDYRNKNLGYKYSALDALNEYRDNNNLSRQEKNALDYVAQGGDPEDAADMYDLGDDSRDRLTSWADLLDQQDSTKEGGLNDLANQFNEQMLNQRMTLNPKVVAQLQKNGQTPDEYNLPPLGNSSFQKMVDKATRAGLSWDPDLGFVPSKSRLKNRRNPSGTNGYGGGNGGGAGLDAVYAQPNVPVNPGRASLMNGNFGDSVGGQQAPIRVSSPEQARQYRSGTLIMTPDGRTLVVP